MRNGSMMVLNFTQALAANIRALADL
jgi:hypothetical protein